MLTPRLQFLFLFDFSAGGVHGVVLRLQVHPFYRGRARRLHALPVGIVRRPRR